ncbi:MAG: mandelate racemase/muconate lactonizing enzyme family protein [Infirmifilum sp.]
MDLKLEAWLVELPLVEPFRISTGVADKSRTLVIRLSTQDGLVGWGEACPSKNVLGETLDDVVEAVKRIKSLYVDYRSLEQIHEYTWTLDTPASLRAALNMALVDLYGKYQSRPIWRLLGGYREFIETDISIGLLEPEEQAKRALRYVEKGFRIIKLKLGLDPVKDVERVRMVRDAVGEGVKIRVDANQGWSVEDAIWVIDRISSYDVELVEQPTRWDDFEGLRKIRRESSIPLALDESVKTPGDVLKAVEFEAADIINIKLMKTRGLTGALRVAYISESAGIKNMIGCYGETRLGITAHVHLAQALRNIFYYDLDCDLLTSQQAFYGGASIENGMRKAGEAAGLGEFSPDWGMFARVI